jgi:hypothetical protein
VLYLIISGKDSLRPDGWLAGCSAGWSGAHPRAAAGSNPPSLCPIDHFPYAILGHASTIPLFLHPNESTSVEGVANSSSKCATGVAFDLLKHFRDVEIKTRLVQALLHSLIHVLFG